MALDVFTLQLGNINLKLVPLLQYALSSLLNECIEFDRKFVHAIAEFLEAKVDVREGVSHRWRSGR